MTAKEYLSQARVLNIEINSYISELENLNKLANSVPGSRFDIERVDGTKSQESPFMKYLIKINHMEEKIRNEVNKLVELKAEISSVISNLENTGYQILLRNRYVSCKTWIEIANEMYCSIDNVYKMHRKALKCVIVPKSL